MPQYRFPARSFSFLASAAFNLVVIVSTGFCELPEISRRDEAQAFYLDEYLPDDAVASGWNGDVALGDPGTVAQEYQNATLRRINWFRSMAGLPAITQLDPIKSMKCALAALMMSANSSLSHFPPTTWTHYTAEGAEAAALSNIALGAAGPGAISLYAHDPGSNNTSVGHRRWVLYPPARVFGSGNVLPLSGFYEANALWVIVSEADGSAGSRPSDNLFVAWPPPGFVPYHVVYPRWSLSANNANFQNAAVQVLKDGLEAPVNIQSRDTAGTGDPAIVWILPNEDQGPTRIHPGSRGEDVVYSVSVSNVSVNGTPRAFDYKVAVVDPRAQTTWTPIPLPNRIIPEDTPTPEPSATATIPLPTRTIAPTTPPTRTSTPPPSQTPIGTITPVAVAPQSPPVLSGNRQLIAHVHRRFRYRATASNEPVVFRYTGKMPAGLKLNDSSGSIKGRPRRAGRFSIRLYAANQVGESGPFKITIRVR